MRKNRLKEKVNREFRVFNEASDTKFKELIDNETWDVVTDDMDAQTQYTSFHDLFTVHYNTAYPLKTQQTRRKNERHKPKPWILPWLEDACSRKNLFYHEFVKEPSTENKTRYDKMNEFCSKHVDLAKSKYYRKYLDDFKDNSKKQWQLINGLLGRNSKNKSIQKIIDKQGNIINTAGDIAEKFNEFFADIAANLKGDSVYRDQGMHNQFMSSPVANSIFLSPVTPYDVHSVIKNFQNKATQDIKISSLKIANESSCFTATLAKVINKSFIEGIFPEQLKTARVVPIHKEGSKASVENYRPISLLASFSKVYEKLMHYRIIKFLESNKSLSDLQYGFRQEDHVSMLYLRHKIYY